MARKKKPKGPAFRDPRSGRFISRKKFAGVERSIKATIRQQLRKAAAAFERMEAAPTKAAGDRAAKALQAARKKAAKAETQARSAGQQRRERGDAYPGWELGVRYVADQRSSNVNFNVRIRRSDRMPMPRYEIEAVIHDLRAEGDLPSGYVVHGIDWNRPGKPSRSGDAADLPSFNAILESTDLRELTQSLVGLPAAALRLGALRADEDDGEE